MGASTSLSGVIYSSLLPAIALIGIVAAPVIAGLTAIGGAFAAILGSGFIAWSKKAGNSMKSIKKEIMPLIRSFGKRFIPLIESAVQALPKLIKQIGKAAGGITPFVNALKALGRAVFRILPKLVGLFMEFGRKVLPAMRTVGVFLAKNLVPALRTLFTVGYKIGKTIADMAMALYNFIKPIGQAISWVSRFGTALWDLGAALAGVGGNISRAFGDVKEVVRKGFTRAIQWLRTGAIPLMRKAITKLARTAGNAFDWLQANLPGIVRSALLSVGNWIRTKGVSLVQRAFRTLRRQAINAFNFTKNKLLPEVTAALRGVWNWISGPGVKIAKKAFNALWKGVQKAFDWLKTDGKRLVQQGAQKVWQWVKGPGRKAAKKAFNALWGGAKKAFNWLKTDGKRLVKKGLGKITTWFKNSGKQSIKNALTKLWQFSTGQLGWQKKIKGWVRDAVKKAKNWAKNQGLKKFKAAFRTLGRNLGKALVGYLEWIQKAFKKVIPKIRKWLKNNGEDIIKKGFKAIGKAIRKLILGLFAIGGIVGQAFVSTMNGLNTWLKNDGAKKIEDAFKGIVGGVVNYLKNKAWGDLKGAAQFLFDAVIAAAQGLWEGLIGKSVIPNMISDIVSYFKNDAWSDLKNAASAMLDGVISAAENFGTDLFNTMKRAAKNAANELISKFNAVLPDSLPVPEVTLGGFEIEAPEMTIGVGQPGPDYTIGGQSIRIQSHTFGGQTLDIPQLDVGGEIEESGLAQVHEGEQIVPAGVDKGYDGSGNVSIGDIYVDATGRDDPEGIAMEVSSELRSVINR